VGSTGRNRTLNAMNRPLPSFQEDHMSQVPPLQLLQNLGYTYLRPQEVVFQRKGRLSNVLLEGILAEQLRQRRFTCRGREYPFSETNIQDAIKALSEPGDRLHERRTYTCGGCRSGGEAGPGAGPST